MTPPDDQSRIPGQDDGTTASAVSTTQERSEPLDPTTYAELREVTRPSALCTRWSIGSSPDRACG